MFGALIEICETVRPSADRLARMPQTFGRREFLGGLAASALRSGASAQSPALFEEVPPARSSIRWTHDNAKSPMRYLPETLGRVSRLSITTTTGRWTFSW